MIKKIINKIKDYLNSETYFDDITITTFKIFQDINGNNKRKEFYCDLMNNIDEINLYEFENYKDLYKLRNELDDIESMITDIYNFFINNIPIPNYISSLLLCYEEIILKLNSNKHFNIFISSCCHHIDYKLLLFNLKHFSYYSLKRILKDKEFIFEIILQMNEKKVLNDFNSTIFMRLFIKKLMHILYNYSFYEPEDYEYMREYMLRLKDSLLKK